MAPLTGSPFWLEEPVPLLRFMLFSWFVSTAMPQELQQKQRRLHRLLLANTAEASQAAIASCCYLRPDRNWATPSFGAGLGVMLTGQREKQRGSRTPTGARSPNELGANLDSHDRIGGNEPLHIGDAVAARAMLYEDEEASPETPTSRG